MADGFARAWERGDYAAMYAALSDEAKRTTPIGAFAQSYRDAAATATATRVDAGRATDPDDGAVTVPVRVGTRIFGTVSGSVRLPLQGSGDDAKVAWTPALTFPGLAPGQALTRNTRLAPRADIIAGDGSRLASGPERTGAGGAIGEELVGSLGPIPPEQRDELRAKGFPDDAMVGVSGLERALNDQLAGTPGGELLAGGRVVARSQPRAARAVRTTLHPRIEEAAIDALAGRVGGIAVMRPTTGEVLALSGIALDGLQPPGSTFKLITTTAALEDRRVKLTDRFPVETAAVLSGVSLANNNGESCGGTFVESFAESCNSVFGPLGVKVGARRLVEMAERYGWNRQPALPGAAMSTLPPAEQIGDDLAVGSTAIGQGKVLATPLQMASVGATIAAGGLQAQPTLSRTPRPTVTRVTTPAIANTIRGLMVEVVRQGTGDRAALRGVTVAGKSGTAELGGAPGADADPGNSDAWFVAFAPARRPRVALAVMLVRAGIGGRVAAPVAGEVLAEALKRTR